MKTAPVFSRYEYFIIALLATLQFAIILDFMVMSPLGAMLMPELKISTSQFGWVVSAYAFSAGISGLLAAGFADRYDRKQLLLFFYAGFIVGTLLCGIAPTYFTLLMARIITGIFGGVIGSIIFAIVTDLFQQQVRGRVMGFVQMAFAGAQVLGLPIGLYVATRWGWHAPFLLIVALALPLLVLTYVYLRPIDGHLGLPQPSSPFVHLFHTVSKSLYLRAFTATTLIATGGYMLMPFGTAYAVNNLGLRLEDLPTIYLLTGIASMALGPVIGKLVDKRGALKVFIGGTALAITLVLVYTHLGITPLWMVIALNIVLFIGITARIISSSTLMSTVPLPQDRGAFMGVNSSVAQISGGLATAVAGMLVHQDPGQPIQGYPSLGWVVTASMIICATLMYFIQGWVRKAYAA